MYGCVPVIRNCDISTTPFMILDTRGVEEISPMQPAAQGKVHWNKYSPTLLVNSTPAGTTVCRKITCLDIHMYSDHFVGFVTAYWPKTLLVHGLKDTTVPDTSSKELAHVLKQKGNIT